MSLRRPNNPIRVGIVGSIVLVALTVLVIGGAAQVNGPANAQRPPEIVDLQPNESDLLLPQGSVGAQLRLNLTGQLTIDGKPIPQDQMSGDPNLAQVYFEPGPGKDIREFARGTHSAVVEWWPREISSAEKARQQHQLRSFSWSFKVG